MGLSSNARLLTITARLTSNEYESQQISNAKMRLATQAQQASDDYIVALNTPQYSFISYDSTGNSFQTALTPAVLGQYADSKNQYILSNSSGKALVSSGDARNFEKSASLTDFLSCYGLNAEYKTDNLKTYYDAVKADMDVDGTCKSWNEVMYRLKEANSDQYAPLSQDVWSMSKHRQYYDVENDVVLDGPQGLYASSLTDYNYLISLVNDGEEVSAMDLDFARDCVNSTRQLAVDHVSYDSWLEAQVRDAIPPEELQLSEEEASQSVNAFGNRTEFVNEAVTSYDSISKYIKSFNLTSPTVTEDVTERYFFSSILRMSPESVKNDKDEIILHGFTDSDFKLGFSAKYNSSSNSVFSCQMNSDTFYAYGIKEYLDNLIENLEKQKEDATSEEEQNKINNHIMLLSVLNGTANDPAIVELWQNKIEALDEQIQQYLRALPQEAQDAEGNRSFSTLWDAISAKQEEVDYVDFILSLNSVSYYCSKTLKDEMNPQTDEEWDAYYAKCMDVQNKANFYHVRSNYDRLKLDLKQLQYAYAWGQKNILPLENEKNLIDSIISGYTENSDYSISNFITAVQGYYEQNTLCKKIEAYENLEKLSVGTGLSASEIKDAYDKLLDFRSNMSAYKAELEKLGINAKDAYFYEDATKAQWYTNLWYKMNGPSIIKNPDAQSKYSVLNSELMTSSTWLTNAIQQGLVSIEVANATNSEKTIPDENNPILCNLQGITWSPRIFSSCYDIVQGDNDQAIAKAEAEYKRKTAEITAKDEKYQRKLTMLDSEHNALQQEYESVKSAMSKNVERSFKAFQG